MCILNIVAEFVLTSATRKIARYNDNTIMPSLRPVGYSGCSGLFVGSIGLPPSAGRIGIGCGMGISSAHFSGMFAGSAISVLEEFVVSILFDIDGSWPWGVGQLFDLRCCFDRQMLVGTLVLGTILVDGNSVDD